MENVCTDQCKCKYQHENSFYKKHRNERDDSCASHDAFMEELGEVVHRSNVLIVCPAKESSMLSIKQLSKT